MRTAVQVGLHDLALNGILADEMGKLLHLSYCALQTGIFCLSNVLWLQPKLQQLSCAPWRPVADTNVELQD